MTTARRPLAHRTSAEPQGLVWLKSGDDRPAIYFFPGGGGDALELDPLAQRLTDGRAIASMQLVVAGQGTTVDDIANRALALINEAQPQGACHLLGYSTGGAIAVEVARRLRAAGREVGLLALIEPVYHRNFWPRGLRTASKVRRALHRLSDLWGAPFGVVASGLHRRASRLFGLAAGRFAKGAGKTEPALETMLDTYYDAMARFRPLPYPGPAVFFTAERADFCCDLRALWRGLVGTLELERVPGDHLGIVRSHASLERLAAGINARLG